MTNLAVTDIGGAGAIERGSSARTLRVAPLQGIELLLRHARRKAASAWAWTITCDPNRTATAKAIGQSARTIPFIFCFDTLAIDAASLLLLGRQCSPWQWKPKYQQFHGQRRHHKVISGRPATG
jgi:hypothetical protein